MPDTPNDFLSSYFYGLSQATRAKELDAERAFKDKQLQFQMREHADTMAQHAKEFSAQQDYRDTMLKLQLSRETREQQNQVRDDLQRFREKGGFFMETPKDKDVSTTMNSGAAQLPDLSMFGASRPPTQPVGPIAPLTAPSMEGLASGQQLNAPPAISSLPQEFRASLPAAMQMPDPEVARPIPAMAGQPTGLTAMQITPQEQIKRDAMARYAAAHENDIPVPKQIQEWAGGNLPAKMPEAAIEKFLLARESDLRARGLAQMADDTKRLSIMMMAALKEKNGLTEDGITANHDSVMNNPDSFHGLDPKSKQAERMQLQKEGLPAPVKLNPTQLGTEEFARRAITSIDTVNKMLDDPKMSALIKKRSGAILGRVGDLEQDIGATQGLSEEEARAIQEFRSNVRYLTFQEGKALFGSRIPIQLMKELQSTSPKSTESISMLQGSMDAVRRNAENTLISAETTRFGGKMRKDFYERNNIKGRTAQEVVVEGFPQAVADKMPEGIAKVFTRKDGDHTYVKRGGKIFELVR